MKIYALGFLSSRHRLEPRITFYDMMYIKITIYGMK